MRTRCSSAFDLKRPFGRARLDAQSWSCPVLNVITAQAQLLQSENDLADSDTQIMTGSSVSRIPAVSITITAVLRPCQHE